MRWFSQYVMLFAALIFYSLFPQKCYAYLDPGTGSYILQMVIAALLIAPFVIKMFWKKIKMFFKKLFSTGENLGG